MTKKCLVLDDEQHCLDILTDYIEKLPGLSLLSAHKNPLEAIPLVQTEKIDIAFIDVQMPNLTGLQFLKLLPKQTKVVFCTAYADYAIEGYELNVVDYLLKPISFERFVRCVQKIDEQIIAPEIKNPLGPNEAYIFVKTESKGKYVRVNIDDILFIEGLGNYQKIKTNDGFIVCQLKMKNLEEQLSSYGFARVHKSFMVPTHKINLIEGNRVSVGTHQIPIGENFKDGLFALLKDKIMV